MWYSIDWWGLHALKDYLASFFLSGFMTPLLAYVVLRWLLSMDLQFKNRNMPKWMRDTSLILYIVHPMVIYLLDLTGMSKGILLWLTATLLSIGASAIFVLVKVKLKLAAHRV